MKKYIATYTVTYTAEFNDSDYENGITDPFQYAEARLADGDLDIEAHETKVEEIREDENGAWLAKDENGRYYSKSTGNYGYNAHFTGAYVCYTCGLLCEYLCECGEGVEDEA